MKNQKNLRIGIIGAGPAGLTAAETLRDIGYADVTLLEKQNHPGGKCRSIKHSGRNYELGAGIVSGNNRTVLDLAKKYGVKTARIDTPTSILLDSATCKRQKAQTVAEKMALFHQLVFKYRKLVNRYSRVSEPGLTKMHRELCVPFSKFAAKHDIELVTKELAKYFTGFGYGYFDEIPAAYVLKYYSWETSSAFLRKAIYKFPDGIQGLWDTVAKNHRVIYNAAIKNIERDDIVNVTTNSEKLRFDALIITSPLDEALNYLDASEAETSLFSKILYYDYRDYSCTVTGFPKKTGFIPGNFLRSRSGQPVFWYKRYSDDDYYTFYVICDWKISDDEVKNNIEQTVRPLGGEVTRFEEAFHWKYFPHVSPKEMRDGYFDKLENLQRKNHTYYAGELPNFSTVDQSASYAKMLMERFF
jgi:predicted NAD/FAD-dependent oxidoreductase